MEDVVFLLLAEVIEIHHDQIERYGGQPQVRDMGLLSSAVSVPAVSFEGRLLHEDIYEMAATYAFHICRNHPFVDGNKRTALACALVFLELNGISLEDPEKILYGTMIDVACGRKGKKDVAVVFRLLAHAGQSHLD